MIEDHAGPGALAARLLRSCRAFPDRPALDDGAEAFNYADVLGEAEAIAVGLRAAGLRPREPVAVAVSNRARDPIAFLAVWLAGGVVTPVHRAAAERSAARTLDRVGARVVVNANPELAAPAALRAASVVQPLARPPPPRRPLLEDAGLILFSSGTTGEPKAVVVGHRRFSAKLDRIDREIGFEDGTRSLLALSLTFAFAQWVALITLRRGGVVHLRRRFDPTVLLADLAGGGIDRAPFVPTMLRAMLAELGGARHPWAGHMMSGGEALPAPVARQVRRAWPGARLWDVYGLAECGTSDFFVRPADYDAAAGSIGRPGEGIRYRITADGELALRSPYHMLGYLDAPGTTAASYDPDGYFLTGDLARERGDGFVELVGRAREVIVRGGNKISPLEVERLYLEHPEVGNALATGVGDARLGEAIHLLVVPRPGAAPDPGALRAWATGRIDGYKRPDVVHVGDALPTGRTGKADRRALRGLIERGGLPGKIPGRRGRRRPDE